MADCDIYSNVAQSLLDRMDLHKRIALQENHHPCADAAVPVKVLRQALFPYAKKSQRMNQAKLTHEYALSLYAFFADSALGDDIRSALLFPRNIGCSSSTPKAIAPTFDEIVGAIKGLTMRTQGRDRRVNLRNRNAVMYASWSSVIIHELRPCYAVELVSLCEFWVQSIWFASFSVCRRANYFNPDTLNGRRYSELNMDQQELNRLINRHRLKLNPNAPPDPSRAIGVLAETSDLPDELQKANEALESAISQARYTFNERSAVTRKLLEVFSLIFASSSLAPLLLPTPINLQIILQHPIMFCIWAALTGVGILLVARQH